MEHDFQLFEFFPNFLKFLEFFFFETLEKFRGLQINKMSGSISVDIGYITKNIHTYIEQGTFFDLFEEEIISEVLKEAKLNPKSFNVLLTLAKSKYTTEELRIFASKCNVDVNSFEEAIIVLESYEKLLQLRPTHSLINYLKKYNNEGTESPEKIAQ